MSGLAAGAAGLYVERHGRDDHRAAAPLVLLHGWAMNLRVFDGLVRRLAKEHALIVLDLPGHGKSAWPSDWTAAGQLELIGSLVPRGATLIGWSLGGQLALALAAQPQRCIRRLVLITTTPRFLRSADWPHGLAPEVLQQFAASLERDRAQAVADFLALQLRGDSNAAVVRDCLLESLQRQGMAQPAALRAGLRLLCETDLRAQARELPVPALLIAGQYDRITPPAAAQALLALLPHAQLLQVPRAGHAPFLSHPEQVGEALAQFLTEPAA